MFLKNQVYPQPTTLTLTFKLKQLIVFFPLSLLFKEKRHMLGEVLEAATTNIMSVFPNMSAAPFDRGPCANDCSFPLFIWD